MKLKGSSKALSAKKVVALFSVGGILFVLLRAYQAVTVIDPLSGFFADKNNITVKLFVVLGVLLAAVSPVLIYLTPLSKAEHIEPKRHFIHGLSCLLLGLAAGYNSYELLKAPGERTKTVLAVMITGAAACLVLVLDAVGFFAGGKLVKKIKILNLIPVLWAIGLTISYFSITTSYINNTVLLVNIFADAFLMLFLFEYAKKFSGIYGDGNSPIFIYSALMCATLELSAVATAVVTRFAGKPDIVCATFLPYRFFAALFCLTALAVMLKNKAPDYVPVSEGDEIETTPFKLAEEPGQTEEADAEVPDEADGEVPESDDDSDMELPEEEEEEPSYAEESGQDDEA